VTLFRHKVAVAGHVCLDIIPTFNLKKLNSNNWLIPGTLNEVGPAIISTGGAVANTGIALRTLGVDVKLMGKIGDDLFGTTTLNYFNQIEDNFGKYMTVASGESSSYTIVLSSEHLDRVFLHCSGTNDTFTIDDIDFSQLEDVDIFHFGYPPLMYQMYTNEGLMLSNVFKKAKQMDVITSLDMAMPDSDSKSGQVDWKIILRHTLPYVDIFLPSIEEILMMLRPAKYKEFQSKAGSDDILSYINGDLLTSLADDLLQKGAKTIVFKLGEHGLYLRTTTEAEMVWTNIFPPVIRKKWINREVIIPSFKVKVAGTTGAGDCTIAGFLASITHHLSPEEALNYAIGAGSNNVQKADATSGMVSWNTLNKQIKTDLVHRNIFQPLIKNWEKSNKRNTWLGPNDNHTNN